MSMMSASNSRMVGKHRGGGVYHETTSSAPTISPRPPLAAASVASSLSQEQLEELREVFTLFDVNQRGVIDAREFKAALRALGFDVKKDHIIGILLEAGKETTECITFEEFCTMMIGRLPDRTSREEVAKLFRLFDEDNTGRISFRSLKKVALEIGESLTDDEIQEMIDEADRDGDGFVNFEDFYKIIKYKNNPLEDSDDDEEEIENLQPKIGVGVLKNH